MNTCTYDVETFQEPDIEVVTDMPPLNSALYESIIKESETLETYNI